MKIKDLPLQERPQEKLEKNGVEQLSNAELLAIILRTGVNGQNSVSLSQELLTKKTLTDLASATPREISSLNGIGRVKACQITACFELGKRVDKSHEEKPSIRNLQDVEKLVGYLKHKKKEYFKTISLDTKQRLINTHTISIGSLDASIVHPREVFKPAILDSAAGIIIAHNHPSGDSTPSEIDIQITKELALAGELMGIELLDHVIIGNKAVSMKKEGLF